MDNPKHKGPHCDGLCEGTAYMIEIRRLKAEIERLKDTILKQNAAFWGTRD